MTGVGEADEENTSVCVVCEEVPERETVGTSAAVLTVTGVLPAWVASTGARAFGRESRNS